MDSTSGESAQAADLPNTPQAQAATPEPQAGDGHDESLSLEEARKLRREAANLRKRLQAYEEAEKQAQEAKLSEIEKLQKQHADMQARHETQSRAAQERIIRYEIKLAAHSAHVIDPDAVVKLLDWSELEFDDDGLPTNVDKLVARLLESKPYLVGNSQNSQAASTAAPSDLAARAHAPALPAMNPGRTQIASPHTRPQGQIPRLSDIFGPPGQK